MEGYKITIRTQKGLILNAMFDNPSRWFLAGDFCGGDKRLPFVGYKAPTRMSEMQKDGYLISRWANKKTALGGRLKEYKVDFDRFKLKRPIFAKEITVEGKEPTPNTLF
jgi:hypothetical protein